MQKMISLFIVAVFVVMGTKAQDTTHKDIVGKYKFPAGSVVEEVTVALDNGALSMSSAVGASPLEVIKGDSFNLVNFNGIAVFKRNEAKKVIAVHIDAGGYILDGTKDSAAVNHVVAFMQGTAPAKNAALRDVQTEIIKNELALRRNRMKVESPGNKE